MFIRHDICLLLCCTIKHVLFIMLDLKNMVISQIGFILNW